MKKRHQQKIILISIVLILLWNIPAIMLFNSDGVILGFPVLYFFIFMTWLLAILTTYIILKKYDK
jgi:hypothetical protein